MSYQSVLESALKLDVNQRARLEIVLESLSAPNPDITHAWEAEAKKRYENYKQGVSAVKDVKEVLKKYGR